MTRDRWLGLAALLGMFGLGLGCGLWLARSTGVAPVASAPETEVLQINEPTVRSEPSVRELAHDAARAHHEAVLQDLQQSVGLDDAQIEQVHAVFVRHQSIVEVTWEAVRPQIEIALEKAHREVAELLGPEQRARYHEWLVARRAGAHRIHGEAGAPEPRP